jgi:hypothetical protein
VAKETASRCCDGNFYTPIITKAELMLRAVQYTLDDLHATPDERRQLAKALREL